MTVSPNDTHSLCLMDAKVMSPNDTQPGSINRAHAKSKCKERKECTQARAFSHSPFSRRDCFAPWQCFSWRTIVASTQAGPGAPPAQIIPVAQLKQQLAAQDMQKMAQQRSQNLPQFMHQPFMQNMVSGAQGHCCCCCCCCCCCLAVRANESGRGGGASSVRCRALCL